MLPVHTILVPTDLSGPSACAFDLACSLARDRGARIEVLHVAGPSEPAHEREALRDRLYRMLKPDSPVRVEWRLESGEAATVILRVAREVHADLIVMGASKPGHEGLLGGVAERVMLSCSCPVLTVLATNGTRAPLPVQMAATATS